VVRALLICSDGECPVLIEAIGDPAEIEALACDCGCGLHILGWPDEVFEERDGLEIESLAA
jgi:hypothetical protein